MFFVIYGEFGSIPALSATRYASAGVPTGFDLFRYSSKEHPDVLSGFQEGYLWDELERRSSLFASRIANATECLILRGEVEESATLNYLRDSVGLLTHLLDNGGIAVYDPHMFQWWEPDVWRDRIFAPAGPVPRHHIVVLTSEEATPSLTWFHTRGMRKFGRPDLSIHNVPFKYNEAIIDLLERFIELQAFGEVVSDGQCIKMNTLPDGMTCHHRGSFDDPDFNNIHLEILWPDVADPRRRPRP